MSNIVNLEEYKTQMLQRKSFKAWEKRFDEAFSLETRTLDLSDSTLYSLANPGQESSFAFYELIMGTLDFGSAAKFGYLEDQAKLRVVDIHLYLADNIRFELMRRLGWLSRYAAQNEYLVTICKELETIKQRYHGQIPELAPSHPEFENYRSLIPRDREALIRRLLAPALEAFKEKL